MGKKERSRVRVSVHTEVNLWVIIDRHVDLLLCLSRPPVVRWRVVVGNGLHRLFDELVSLVFQAFPIAMFAGVDTATKVVVLRRRRRGSRALTVSTG